MTNKNILIEVKDDKEKFNTGHTFYLLKTKKNTFFIDTVVSKYQMEQYMLKIDKSEDIDTVISLFPIITYKDSEKIKEGKFQSSGDGCGIMSKHIGNLLKNIDPDYLDTCVKIINVFPSYTNIGNAIDNGYGYSVLYENKEKTNILYRNKQRVETFTAVFDWGKFYEKYPDITIQIFSFCQSEKYMKRLFQIYGINFDDVLCKEVTINNKSTSLRSILEKNKDKQGHNIGYKNIGKQ
jgi:hypothetical protein